MNKNLRNTIISVFVIVWTILFHYESIRYFYIQPHFKKPVWKTPLLFPPAGWIMFYNVNDDYGYVDVYGIKDKKFQLIDPHDIFRTRTIGFDNIHRNILSTVADPALKRNFCGFLKWRFPPYQNFAVVANYYPSLTREPTNVIQQIKYQCIDTEQ